MLRWAVDVGSWRPSSAEWQLLLLCLPASDQADCTRFVHKEDQQRALVSRLLQRRCLSTCLGIPPAAAQIRRTAARKPYCANQLPASLPNLNFNVSHEGRYVVLVSEPLCVCGVDVTAPGQLRRGRPVPIMDAFQPFLKELSPAEWQDVHSFSPDAGQMEAAFQRYWCLKEAFIKARGDGLGFQPLSRAEFRLVPSGSGVGFPTAYQAQLYLDGVPQSRWKFSLQELSGGHWVAAARGPPDAVWDPDWEFRQGFLQPQPSDQQLQLHLDAPELPFDLLGVEDLVPENLLCTYQATLQD